MYEGYFGNTYDFDGDGKLNDFERRYDFTEFLNQEEARGREERDRETEEDEFWESVNAYLSEDDDDGGEYLFHKESSFAGCRADHSEAAASADAAKSPKDVLITVVIACLAANWIPLFIVSVAEEGSLVSAVGYVWMLGALGLAFWWFIDFFPIKFSDTGKCR